MGSVDRQAGIEKNKQRGLQLVILGHRQRTAGQPSGRNSHACTPHKGFAGCIAPNTATSRYSCMNTAHVIVHCPPWRASTWARISWVSYQSCEIDEAAEQVEGQSRVLKSHFFRAGAGSKTTCRLWCACRRPPLGVDNRRSDRTAVLVCIVRQASHPQSH